MKKLKDLLVLWIVLSGFLGYVIGRIGHVLGGHTYSLHHWIPALVFMIVSPFFHKYWWWSIVFSFGVGFFISDWIDFINFRIIGVDVVEEYHFWGFD